MAPSMQGGPGGAIGRRKVMDGGCRKPLARRAAAAPPGRTDGDQAPLGGGGSAVRKAVLMFSKPRRSVVGMRMELF
jgi:hypothetical protein